MKHNPDKTFVDWQLQQYRKYYSRAMRYQELMHTLKGNNTPNSIVDKWRLIAEAMEFYFLGSVHPAKPICGNAVRWFDKLTMREMDGLEGA